MGHAHPCTLLRAGRTWHHALFPSRRRPVAHQVRREYRRYGTHLTRRTLPSMCATTATQMARSASSCSSRSTVRRATLITKSGRAVRCDGLRAPGSTPPSPLTTESGAERLLGSTPVSYLSTLTKRADGDRPKGGDDRPYVKVNNPVPKTRITSLCVHCTLCQACTHHVGVTITRPRLFPCSPKRFGPGRRPPRGARALARAAPLG